MMNRSMSLSMSILSGKKVLDQNGQEQLQDQQVRPTSGMNRKVKNCLKRIEKNEEKERKILQNKRKELTTALQETEKLLEQRQKKLDKTTSVEEHKIDDEIQKISNRLNWLQAEKLRLSTHRENELEPLRQQSSDLKEKLKIVDRQMSGDGEPRRFDQFRRLSSRDSAVFDDEDFSPSSPPPYQP